MTIDLTPIFQAVIALLAALITTKLIPWIKARTTEQQQTLLQSTIRILVYAAEQLYGAGGGAEKLSYVKAELKTRGYDVDIASIEAAVREMSFSEAWSAEYATGHEDNIDFEEDIEIEE